MSTYIKIGGIADLQGRNDAIGYKGGDDFREPKNWEAKSAEFTASMNAASPPPSICIDAGDVIDNQTGNPITALATLIEIVAAQTATVETKLDMDIIRVRGNHDITPYAEADHQDWFDAVDLGGVHPTRANTRQTDVAGTTPNPAVAESYTYDFGGYRFIVYQYSLIAKPNADDLIWLGARIAETTLPVIIVTHKPLWFSPTGGGSGGLWQNVDPDDFYAVMDAYPNVQAVFSGHYHMNGSSIIREGIHYISLAGSVWEDNPGDNAYFIIEIISDAVKTDVTTSVARSTPNIKITGFGNHGIPYAKDHDKYVVI